VHRKAWLSEVPGRDLTRHRSRLPVGRIFMGSTQVGSVVMAALTLLAAACSGPSSSPATSTVINDLAAPASPAFCHALSRSASIRDLQQSLGSLSDPTAAGQAADAVRSAAKSLRDIGQTAPSHFWPAFDRAASALDSLAAKGISNSDAVNGSSQALTDLGTEVQSQCRFPLG
jgi:hypothetical protein